MLQSKDRKEMGGEDYIRGLKMLSPYWERKRARRDKKGTGRATAGGCPYGRYGQVPDYGTRATCPYTREKEGEPPPLISGTGVRPYRE